MASISTNDSDVALKKGSTWGTAGDITSGGLALRCSSLTYNGGHTDFVSRDIGWSKKPTEQKRLVFSGNLSVSADMTFGQPWLFLLALVMGTEGTATEQTGGQGDYLHAIDLNDDITGLYTTVAWNVEDDRSVEIPSWKPNTFTISADANNVGTFSCSGPFDQLVTTGMSNTAAEVAAVTASTGYQAAVFGGTNAYLRLDSVANAPLTSGDNKEILGWSLTINRPVTSQHVLRGANSAYIVEPFDHGMIEGTLTLRFAKIDDGNEDLMAYWRSQTQLLAEIFVDGTAIGSGVNRSVKIQMPLLEAMGAIPPGHDIPNNNALMTPSISFKMLKASAAPSGMTGVTDLIRVTSIDPRSSKWTA